MASILSVLSSQKGGYFSAAAAAAAAAAVAAVAAVAAPPLEIYSGKLYPLCPALPVLGRLI